MSKFSPWTHLASLIIGLGIGYSLIKKTPNSDHSPNTHRQSQTDQHHASSSDSLSVPSAEASSGSSVSQTEAPTLTIEYLETLVPSKKQLKQYLESSQRHPHALLACALVDSNPDWLREALQKAPNDPFILFHAASNDDFGFSQKEQLTYLAAFHKNNPQNTYSYALLAKHRLTNGDPQSAIDTLKEIPETAHFNDYRNQTLAEKLDLSLATGSAPPEILKMATLMNHSSAHKFEVFKLSKKLNKYAKKLSAEEAEDIRILTTTLGEGLTSGSGPHDLVSELVSIGVISNSIKGQDPSSPSPYEGLTNEEALEMLDQRKDNANASTRALWDRTDFNQLLLDPNQRPLLRRYIERQSLLNESDVNDWMLRQLNTKSSSGTTPE